MSIPDISRDIRDFIVRQIHSVELLEVLLLCHREAQRWWDADEVSRRLYTNPASAATRLADLESKALLRADNQSPRRYQYAPPPTDVAARVDALAHLYKERRVKVIELIYSKDARDIRSFSDAFKVKKKEGT